MSRLRPDSRKVVKVSYKAADLIGSMIGGLLVGLIFNRAWSAIEQEDGAQDGLAAVGGQEVCDPDRSWSGGPRNRATRKATRVTRNICPAIASSVARALPKLPAAVKSP